MIEAELISIGIEAYSNSLIPDLRIYRSGVEFDDAILTGRATKVFNEVQIFSKYRSLDTSKRPMTGENGHRYEFGPFRLDPAQRLLLRDGVSVHLPLKSFELLAFFVANPNQVIDKETLMLEVWPEAFVEDANLSVHVSTLRKALRAQNGVAFGDDLIQIETFPKVGYRLNADVRIVENCTPESFKSPSTPDQTIQGTKFDPAEFVEPSLTKNESASRNTSLFAFALIIVIVIVASGYAGKRFFESRRFQTQTMTRVPGTEQSSAIAISPNGEYIAHAISNAGKRTLMMTHIGSGSSVQLLPPDNALFWGMTFSNDGSFLYFVKTGNEVSSLFKLPVLGSNAVKILDNIENKITFSPDGTRFAFVRKLSDSETAVMTANVDGSDERVVAVRNKPHYFGSLAIAWSPDGKVIANAAGTFGQSRAVQVIGIDVETGTETVLSDAKWANSDGLVWLGDGTGLIASLVETATAPLQLWFISYPSGEPRPITNDLKDYGNIGVTSDSKTIMAGQFEDQSSIWLVPGGRPDQARPITTDKHHQFKWIRWAAGGKLVFGSSNAGTREIWTINADGTDARQLTFGKTASIMPVASSDGKYIVFASSRGDQGVSGLWRMDANGENLLQLTNGEAESQPAFTPDGKWIFYTLGKMDGSSSKRSVWKVPVEGGESIRHASEAAYAAAVSPDGQFVACWYRTEVDGSWKVAILPIEGANPIKLLDLPPGPFIRWTADGKGISFIKTVDAVSNIWTQPLDGGEQKQETNFATEQIANFDWSHDNQLVVSRFQKTRDVVLVRNFR